MSPMCMTARSFVEAELLSEVEPNVTVPLKKRAPKKPSPVSSTAIPPGRKMTVSAACTVKAQLMAPSDATCIARASCLLLLVEVKLSEPRVSEPWNEPPMKAPPEPSAAMPQIVDWDDAPSLIAHVIEPELLTLITKPS